MGVTTNVREFALSVPRAGSNIHKSNQHLEEKTALKTQARHLTTAPHISAQPVAQVPTARTSLNVPVSRRGRSPSPDTFSVFSADEFSELQLVRSNTLERPPDQQNDTYLMSLESNKPSSKWRRDMQASWLRNKGLALVFFAQFFGSLMTLATRLLETEGSNGDGMHPFQILFARMTITVILSSLYMWYTNTPDFPFGKREIRPLLIARGLGGFFGVFGLYSSLQYLPLADATILTFIAPIIACWACSKLIHEPFTRTEQLAGIVSLAGVILIARPDFIFRSSTTSTPNTTPGPENIPRAALSPPTDSTNRQIITPSERVYAVSMAMLGVLGASIAYTTIRWIGRRAHPLISVNYFAFWCTLVSTFFLFCIPSLTTGTRSVLPSTSKEYALLVFVGVTGFGTQYLLTAGLRYEKSSRATGMVYTSMLFAIAFDKAIWGVSPGLWSWCGSGLILGAALVVALQKARVPVEKDENERSGTREEERGLVEGIEDGEGDDVAEEVPMRVLRERPRA